MKRWVLILLLPLRLLSQESYFNCGNIAPQDYTVSYDANKSYYWDISDGEILFDNGNSITVEWPDSIGTYVISVRTIRFGCYGDTSYREVFVEECPYIRLFIPTSFTPNEDGHNDIFFIKGKEANDIEHMAIYNRWGTKVLESNTNVPWSGENSPDGIYVITVFFNNKKFTKSIILVR